MTKSKLSAGLLVYRRTAAGPEVLLVHPGGPFFARKDLGAWSIPKGEPNTGEELIVAAQREFAEEVGQVLPPPTAATYIALGHCKQRGGKVVHAWACEADLNIETLGTSSFELEWPPRSGQLQAFPEIDAARYFDIDTARQKLNPGQLPLLDRLLEALAGRS